MPSKNSEQNKSSIPDEKLWKADSPNDGELEDAVIKTFEVVGVKVTKRSFYTIHRLRNKKVVIAKLPNRRDALALLRNKRKLLEHSQDGKRKLKRIRST